MSSLGPYPHWLFLTSRGELRLHPMSIDGSISTFAPFHNVNCPQGFLYFNRISELRICVLPGHLSYDAPWPVRKVPLRYPRAVWGLSRHQMRLYIKCRLLHLLIGKFCKYFVCKFNIYIKLFKLFPHISCLAIYFLHFLRFGYNSITSVHYGL